MIFEISLIFLTCLIYLYVKFGKMETSLRNEHFVITGGSSGIGLALAIEVAKKGGNITIIARSEDRLKTAKEKIKSHVMSEDQKILTFAADVCKDHERLVAITREAENVLGPIGFLVTCAGTSVSYRFDETPIEEFSRMIEVNYLGSVYAAYAVIPLMKLRKTGRITFVSSLAGLVGLYGYTAYSGSKFALVGMAAALQMEAKPFNINVTVSFPPDTDTPGFAEEIKSKPIETKLICESGGLFSSEKVASKILADTIKGKFMSSVGFEGWMICTVCSGLTPVFSFFELVLQVITMGFFRLVSCIYLFNCDRTIKKYAKENQKLDKEVKKS